MQDLQAIIRATAFRLALVIAGGFAVMGLALFGFIYWQTAVHEERRIDGVITREAFRIANGPSSEAVAALDRWIAEDLHANRYAGLFAFDGRHLGGNLKELPALDSDGQARTAVFVGIERDREAGEPETVRAIALRLDNRQTLVIGYDIDELEDVRGIILRALSLGLLPMVALALACGVGLALRAQGRIAAMHEAVGRIMRGQLDERLPVRGTGDDLDRLAAAVNGMLRQIEHLVGEIRQIGDNIAHDLRTPLTRLRTRLERGRDEARTPEAFQTCMDRAVASVDQALDVVSTVLRIGEIEHSRRKTAFRPVDLAELAQDAFELYEPLADEKGLALHLEVGSVPPVFGDPDMLLEAVGNLLDNALKFAPSGTVVTLSVGTAAGRTLLRVADRGPGIPAVDRHRVTRRFFRGEESRTVDGNGLGLSLVSAITALHAFRLTIADAEPGCLVTIDGPALVPGLVHAGQPAAVPLNAEMSIPARVENGPVFVAIG